MFPALKNAEFLRYGVMHKNTYINAPKVLNADFSMKQHPTVYFAGQITGVEGYVESTASGLVAAINLDRRLCGKEPLALTSETVIGALANYVATPNSDFQPMNANYGVLKPLLTKPKKKADKKRFYEQHRISRHYYLRRKEKRSYRHRGRRTSYHGRKRGIQKHRGKGKKNI